MEGSRLVPCPDKLLRFCDHISLPVISSNKYTLSGYSSCISMNHHGVASQQRRHIFIVPNCRLSIFSYLFRILRHSYTFPGWGNNHWNTITSTSSTVRLGSVSKENKNIAYTDIHVYDLCFPYTCKPYLK